jgi:HEAT repeat protein
MPTLEDIRRELGADEPDYRALADTLGTDALPQLEELVVEADPGIAPGAAYLAGLIASGSCDRLVLLALDSKHAVVRVAAAATLTTLHSAAATRIANKLLDDDDVGVRAWGVRYGAESWALGKRVKARAANDDEPAIRELADRLFDDAVTSAS